METSLYQTDPLLAVQEATREHLSAKLFLQGIPVITADKGDVDSAIKTALGKLGLCIIVEPATSTLGYSGTAVQFAPRLNIIIWENVIINRGAAGTRKRASAVALAVALALAPRATPTPPIVGESIEMLQDSAGASVYNLSATVRLTVNPQ
jgi:hypothetical protein